MLDTREREREKSDRICLVISVGYTYLALSEKANAVLVAHDSKIGCIMAWIVPAKGGFVNVAHRACQWSDGIGHNKMVLKANQELAITDLQKTNEEKRTKAFNEILVHIKSIRGMEDEIEIGTFPMVIENFPVGESQSNGAVENAIRRVQGQIRIVKIATEEAKGKKIPADPAVWQWLVEHCADTFNRYRVGTDGATPYKRIKGRESGVPIAAFGEKVHYHLPKKQMFIMDEMIPAWSKGILLGLLWMGNEYIIGTIHVVLRAHSITRLLE